MAEVEETHWITLADGTRLAARIWWPEGPGPHPAVLEYLPYRRRDGTARRDESTYPAFAASGIAGVRVDSRGQGDSDGLFDDEYSPQELADCCEVIAWIAAQDWSNGAVGMMGISWGGFNSLQVAALRPPALKAVISIASTADRYADDIHYKGGCLLGANIYWAGTMLSYTSRPPDPEVLGNSWRETWLERLAAMPPILETWLRHQHRDAYWRHGSICEDWSAIQCPVFVIAGWADGYRNTPATLARHLEAPVKAMTGPWVHLYPHFAAPEPRADFLGMAVDWWRQHLAGEARGVEDWPDYRAWIAESPRPGGHRAQESGRWIGTDWPGGMVTDQQISLGGNGTFGATPGPRVVVTPQTCGTASGEYFTLSPGDDLPGDQRVDDTLSTCWQGEVLEAPLDLLGRARVRARVTVDRPQANLIARLVDVHPDGAATLIARGALNLTHREGHAAPRPMVPGEAVEVTLALDEMGYRVLPGHRLRLALSTAYWPLIQPSPAAVSAQVDMGSLTLPVLGDAVEAPPPPITGPSPLPDYPTGSPAKRHRHVTRELLDGRTRYEILDDSGHITHPGNGMTKRESRAETWEIHPDDPAGATGHLVFEAERARGDWEASTRVEIRFQANAESYDATLHLTAETGGDTVFDRHWEISVPRDGV
ncbi:MAG: CocE/NonD family hydrolase [Pseudomonadota bacterium]